jgi:hypothetical protein
MTALIPSKIRVLAHRHMARSALQADSSLACHHMALIRILEVQGGVQCGSPTASEDEFDKLRRAQDSIQMVTIY